MTGGVDGIGLAALGVGGLFVYSGIRGYSVLKSTQNLVLGKAAVTGQSAEPLTTGASAAGQAGSTSAIASNALTVIGHAYIFGGTPGVSGGNPWDCSSCANWVVGKMSGLPIPGDTSYDGSSHGPNTLEWLAWSGCETVSHNGNDAQSGDLAVWQTHMGICTGPNEMVSAQNPVNGTEKSSINNFIPEFLFIRRIIIGNPHA